jgi:putative addiction module component (TIGR02574 family)
MATEELLERAKALPPAEQLALVEALLNELDRPDDAIDAAWMAEAQDRLAAYRKGQIRAIPLEDVLRKYRTR